MHKNNLKKKKHFNILAMTRDDNLNTRNMDIETKFFELVIIFFMYHKTVTDLYKQQNSETEFC